MTSLRTILLDQDSSPENLEDEMEIERRSKDPRNSSSKSSQPQRNALHPEDSTPLIKVARSKLESMKSVINNFVQRLISFEDTVYRLETAMENCKKQDSAYEKMRKTLQNKLQQPSEDSSDANGILLQVPSMLDQADDLVNYQRMRKISELSDLLKDSINPFLVESCQVLMRVESSWKGTSDHQQLKDHYKELQENYKNVEDTIDTLKLISESHTRELRRNNNHHQKQSTISQFSQINASLSQKRSPALSTSDSRNYFEGYKYQPYEGSSSASGVTRPFNEDDDVSVNDIFAKPSKPSLGASNSSYGVASGALRTDKKVSELMRRREEEEAEWDALESAQVREQEQEGYFHDSPTVGTNQEKSQPRDNQRSGRKEQIDMTNFIVADDEEEEDDDDQPLFLSEKDHKKKRKLDHTSPNYYSNLAHEVLIASPRKRKANDSDDYEVNGSTKGDDSGDSEWIDSDKKELKKKKAGRGAGGGLKKNARPEVVKKGKVNVKSPSPPLAVFVSPATTEKNTKSNGKYNTSSTVVIELDG